MRRACVRGGLEAVGARSGLFSDRLGPWRPDEGAPSFVVDVTSGDDEFIVLNADTLLLGSFNKDTDGQRLTTSDGVGSSAVHFGPTSTFKCEQGGAHLLSVQRRLPRLAAEIRQSRTPVADAVPEPTSGWFLLALPLSIARQLRGELRPHLTSPHLADYAEAGVGQL
jgi:hypothetical protein